MYLLIKDFGINCKYMKIKLKLNFQKRMGKKTVLEEKS